jgi:hypothetical protein
VSVIDWTCLEVDCEDRKDHYQAADVGVNEKFNASIITVFPTPDHDQEIHGDKYNFPEDYENEKVQCDKNTHYTKFEYKDKPEEFHSAHFFCPGEYDSKRCYESR